MKQSFYLAIKYLHFHRIRTLVLVASIGLILYLPNGLQRLISESEIQMMRRADPARGCGDPNRIDGDEFDSLQKSTRVMLRVGRQCLEDPHVTTALLGVSQLLSRPPGHGVPPEQRHRNDLDQAYPVIAAARVGQLVRDQRVTFLFAKLREQSGGKQDHQRPHGKPEGR